ncbi:hypothetical protein [Streptomyces sp. NPDC003395]
MTDITMNQLQQAITDIDTDLIRSMQTHQALAKRISEEADETARIAEQIGSMRVDPDTVSETRECAKIMAGLSDTATAYAASCHTTMKAGESAYHQLHTSHLSIRNAVNRSGVTNIHDVDRDWLRQE